MQQLWYGRDRAPFWLRPLAALYGALAAKRRRQYRQGDKTVWQAPVPVVVVGNISVGGTGKTPLTQALCTWLVEQGWRPGIVSRGYGGRSDHYPLRVEEHTAASACGDEPLLLAQTTGCPVVVDPDRARAARHLLANTDCNLILSDDGLQHYALGRDVEIAVVDGERGLGNGALMPAGPLREPASRLDEVDLVVINGGDWMHPGAHRMTLLPGPVRRLDGTEADISPGPVHGLAGIGNPQRFFRTLHQLGYQPQEHPLPDHHQIRAEDLEFGDPLPLIMTAKDAVKCRAFASDNRYYLPVNAELPAQFFQQLAARLRAVADKGC
nr:tetraacyldisaccharide 4'-kinase [Motiliproteus sediminis]